MFQIANNKDADQTALVSAFVVGMQQNSHLLKGVELRHFFHPKCLAVICDSNSFHFFIFKLCIMIVHTLKMCTFYFVHI